MDRSDLSIGQRVALHPATDLWMRGVRFADVVKIGRKWVTVEAGSAPFQDRPSRFKIAPANLLGPA